MVAVLQLRTDLQLAQCLVLAASNFCPEADDLIPCRGSQLCPVMAAAAAAAAAVWSLPPNPCLWPCSRTLQQTTWLHHKHPIERRPPDGARALRSEHRLTGLSTIRDRECWLHRNMHWQSGLRSYHRPVRCFAWVYSVLLEGWAAIHKRSLGLIINVIFWLVVFFAPNTSPILPHPFFTIKITLTRLLHMLTEWVMTKRKR